MFAGDSLPGENLPADWVGMNGAYWVASMTEDEQLYLSWPGSSELLSAVGKKRCSPVFQRGYGMTYKSERLNQDSKSIGV